MTLENILWAQNDFCKENITQKYPNINIKTNRKLITKLPIVRKTNALCSFPCEIKLLKSTLLAVISWRTCRCIDVHMPSPLHNYINSSFEALHWLIAFISPYVMNACLVNITVKFGCPCCYINANISDESKANRNSTHKRQDAI